eukprot:5115590-Prymnesium_polylepis.2
MAIGSVRGAAGWSVRVGGRPCCDVLVRARGRRSRTATGAKSGHVEQSRCLVRVCLCLCVRVHAQAPGRSRTSIQRTHTKENYTGRDAPCVWAAAGRRSVAHGRGPAVGEPEYHAFTSH